MERITMNKNSKKYGFSKGDKFPVLRTIMMDCVVIRQPNATNIVWSERMARNYGTLSGVPQLG